MTQTANDEIMTPADLRRYISQQSESWRKMGASPGAWMMQELVLRVGVDCIAQPLPSRYARGAPKYCFHNAGLLVRRSKHLRYCEGFICHPRLSLPIHHAWCIDAENRVVDPTLTNGEHTYVGVPITKEEHRWWCDDSQSVMINFNETIRIEFMLDRCPALADLMKKDAA